MRVLFLPLLAALVGCASNDLAQRDPYPVAPQTVTVHFLSDKEWSDKVHERILGGAWGMPGDIKGTTHWETNEDGEIISCDIYLPAGEPPSRYVLSHEMRHCYEGAFHD